VQAAPRTLVLFCVPEGLNGPRGGDGVQTFESRSRVVIYALDEGMWFERNWNSFPYVFEERERRWIPDFRLKDGTYLEIKGYALRQAEAKFAAFPHELIVVKRENMKFVFEHVVNKYGRDFTRLYG
jgi:hypothetical protein